MTGKHATPLIGWHSADPALKPWIKAEAERRDVTASAVLDEALRWYRAWLASQEQEAGSTT